MAEGTMKAPAGLLAARSATASAVSRDAILCISVLFFLWEKKSFCPFFFSSFLFL
jgi:hypothetical protein